MQENVKLALEQVERAIAKSQQPRFKKTIDKDAFFASTIRWVNQSTQEEPPYRSDSRTRDKWLSNYWRWEPHLAGVLSSVNAIDSNRGWELTGGRNQVLRFLPVFRDADDNSGWRQYVSQQSQAFYACDIGSITETARDGTNGPLREIYHLDPTKCYLTGERRTPLHYDKNKDSWTSEDFFRLVSMKNIDEDFYGLGFCAVSRCLEMAKIMLAIYGYELEQLGAKAPRGLLLLQNIGQDQWQEAMKTREAALDSKMRKYYDSVAVIAQQGFDNVDAKLIALSNLPEGFNLEMFTNLLMHAYSLCFNYDSNEFWPASSGALGRGRETDVQHRKGTGKGGLNFMLAYQDQMASQLPSTLLFEFEQRDQEGVLLDAAVAQAWANVAATLYAGGASTMPGPAGPNGGSGEPATPTGPAGKPGKDNQSETNPKDVRPAAGQIKSTPNSPQGAGMLSLDEVRQMLAMNGVIPMSWTKTEEEATATDAHNVESEKERMLERPSIRRAIEQYPHEPIVSYSWPTDKMRIVFKNKEHALSATRFTMIKPEYPVLPLIEEEEETRTVPMIEDNHVYEIPTTIPVETEPRHISNGLNIYQRDTEPLRVTVRRDGQEVDVSKSTQIWYTIKAKDDPTPLVLKELGRGISVDRSVVTVEFEPEDTEHLYGNYLHTLKVADDLGRTYTVYHGWMAVFKETSDA